MNGYPSPNMKPGMKAYDFHSLAWDIREGDVWTQRFAISREDFERGAPRRWVSALHSIDSTTGTAILKVAESQPPDAKGSVHFEYSCREWDLLHNQQLRMIRVCVNPFELYEDTAEK